METWLGHGMVVIPTCAHPQMLGLQLHPRDADMCIYIYVYVHAYVCAYMPPAPRNSVRPMWFHGKASRLCSWVSDSVRGRWELEFRVDSLHAGVVVALLATFLYSCEY